MKTRELIPMGMSIIAMLTTHRANAQTNLSCSGSNPCVTANCNSVGFCMGSENDGPGSAMELSSDNNSVTLSSVNDGTGGAVLGWNLGSGIGVAGQAISSYGVFGMSTSGAAVHGTSSTGNGVEGASTSQYGVYGTSSTANGVVGQNSRTDWNAAAISALPGNSNGLGIYSGGGAMMPGGGMWASTSDARVKKDVKDFRLGLAELKDVRTVSYKYNGLGGTQDDGHEFVGVIAQELEKVLPTMVRSSRAKLHPGDSEETDIKRVDPSAFTYVLINAVQEQQKIIERQDARIARLESGRASLISSIVPGGFGLAALGLVPLGLVASRRRRKEQES